MLAKEGFVALPSTMSTRWCAGGSASRLLGETLPDTVFGMCEELQPRARSIFFSYRRDDSEEVVDRIYETLSASFSEDALFRDVDDIEPAANFPQVIRECLRDCDVVLVFIGRDWLTAALDGRPRLFDPTDHLRQEIQAALTHPYAQVIPVCVKRAKMPSPEEVPPALRSLLEIHAIEVRSRGRDYATDVATLAATIRKGLAASQAKRQMAAERRAREGSGREESSTAPELAPSQWDRLIRAAAEDAVVVICGSELGTDPKQGDPRCREHAIAVEVARILTLEVPALEARRPLAQLAAVCQRGNRRDEFARALGEAAGLLTQTAATSALTRLEPLKLFITSALDRTLEAALALRSSHETVDSLSYTVNDSFALQSVDPRRSGGMVFHAAGFAGGLDGDAAVTDADWRRFQDAWRDRQPGSLGSLFEGRDILFLGGGYPSGFVAFWLDMVCRLRCRSLWIGSSACSDDSVMAVLIGDSVPCEKIVFDDSDTAVFLAEFLQRWLGHQPADAADPLPIAAPDGETGMGAVGVDDRSPWPGLSPYTEADSRTLFGRELEIQQVVDALLAHTVTVLYARSGAGKTSLLLAGVNPRLRKLGLIPVVVRVNWAASRGVSVRREVMQCVHEASRAGLALPPPAVDDSLWTYFHRRDGSPANGRDGRSAVVLVFDQFEEVFSLRQHSTDTAEKASAAVRDLADLVESRVPDEVRERVRTDPSAIEEFDIRRAPPSILIAVREDFLAELTALGMEMPSLRKSSVRIAGLTLEAASEIVLRAVPGIFTPDAARELVDTLSTKGPPELAWRSVGPTATIEPALLSLTCLRLDQMRRARGLEHVDVGLVREAGVAVLDSFYDEALADLDPALRKWVASELITASGRRGSVTLGSAGESLRSRGISLQSMDILVNRRILRVMWREDVGWVELTHDLLIPAAMRSREGATSGSVWSVVGRFLGFK